MWSFGLNAQQNAGLFPVDMLGLTAQKNVGFAPPTYLPWWGLSAQQNTGFIGAPTIGFSGQQNVGFPGSGFGPFSWGFNPQYSWGMNAMQNAGLFMPPPFFGLGGQQANVHPYGPSVVPVMVPYPVPAQTQSSVQPVQCSINQVPALTKSVDDCEKAGGEVPAVSKTAAVQEAKK